MALQKRNRRWVVSQEVPVRLDGLTLDEAIHLLSTLREWLHDATLTVKSQSPHTWIAPAAVIVASGYRYATREEVAQHNETFQRTRERERLERKNRIQQAIDILEAECPGAIRKEALDEAPF